MAGWLTFEQMQLGLDNLREAELAKPLDSIARGRGYEIKGEFPLPRCEGRRGARPKADFLLVCHKRRIAIAIETKYKKKGKRMAGSIGADASRLGALRIEALEDLISQGAAPAFSQPVAGYALLVAVIVVWHQSDIMEQMRLEPAAIKKQFIDLVSALLPKDAEPNSRHFAEAMLGKLPTFPVGRKAGALRPGSTFTYKRFWVACFIERASWKGLALN